MTIDNLEDRLAAKQEAFDKASADSLYDLPPDGEYEALVREFDVFESKAGELFLKIELEVQHHAEYSGRRPVVIHSLENEERMGFLKKDLRTLGLNVEGLGLVEIRPGSDLLKALLDTPVVIAVKTSKSINEKTGEPFVNVYINKRLGGPIRSDVPVPEDPVGVTANGGGGDNEEMPF